MNIIASQTTLQYADSIQGGTASSGEFQQARGQSFTSDGQSVIQISIFTYTFGTPTGDWILTLRSGSITGAILGTVTKACSSLVNGGVTDFTFASSIPTSAATKYYIQIVKSPDVNDTSNYGMVSVHDGNLYSGGGYFARNNNSWGSEDTVYDMYFIAYAPDPTTSTTTSSTTSTSTTTTTTKSTSTSTSTTRTGTTTSTSTTATSTSTTHSTTTSTSSSTSSTTSTTTSTSTSTSTTTSTSTSTTLAIPLRPEIEIEMVAVDIGVVNY